MGSPTSMTSFYTISKIHTCHTSQLFKQDKTIKCITTVWFFPIFSTLTYDFLVMTLSFSLMTQFLPFGFKVSTEFLWFLRVLTTTETLPLF